MSAMPAAVAALLAAAAFAFAQLVAVPTTEGAVPAAVLPAAAVAPVTGVTISGLDLHDGTLLRAGGRYHLYGTRYGCGFRVSRPSPWCGLAVATAPNLAGPWSTPVTLVAPTGSARGTTWQHTCGDSGAGCFNPRMVQRTGWGPDDGAWLLWFNAPDDWNSTGGNAYWVATCAGPDGPCGQPAKPILFLCWGNGDFSIVRDDPRPPVMLCTQPDQTLASERLAPSGTSGAGLGHQRLAGLTHVEAPGAYRDRASGRWVLTYSDPNCGYCAGTGTGYATAAALDGLWTAPPPGRRTLSATTCGGQPRTVVEPDGTPAELIDLWRGTPNETAAAVRLEPLRTGSALAC